MKAYWSSGSIAPGILDGGEWSVSRPGSFIPRERASSTHWIGGWVGLRAGLLDAAAKREYICPCQESNPSRLTLSLVNYTGIYVRVYTHLCVYVCM